MEVDQSFTYILFLPGGLVPCGAGFTKDLVPDRSIGLLCDVTRQTRKQCTIQVSKAWKINRKQRVYGILWNQQEGEDLMGGKETDYVRSFTCQTGLKSFVKAILIFFHPWLGPGPSWTKTDSLPPLISNNNNNSKIIDRGKWVRLQHPCNPTRDKAAKKMNHRAQF